MSVSRYYARDLQLLLDHEFPDRGGVQRLRELRDELVGLRPVGEITTGIFWHESGPLRPPTSATRMCLMSWLCVSDYGRARGLAVRADHGTPILQADDAVVAWHALSQALRLPVKVLEAVFSGGAVEIYEATGHDRGELRWADEGYRWSTRVTAQAAARIDAIVGGARRVLSSR